MLISIIIIIAIFWGIINEVVLHLLKALKISISCFYHFIPCKILVIIKYYT